MKNNEAGNCGVLVALGLAVLIILFFIGAGAAMGQPTVVTVTPDQIPSIDPQGLEMFLEILGLGK